MVEAHLNIFDAVVLGIMGLSCLFAFFRGLVREILSLAAWVGAGIITIYYFPAASAKLAPHFKSAAVSAGIATVGLYIGALAVFGIINMFLIKSIKSGGEAGTPRR
jgi:membrane protein required for colicin V production